MGIGYNDDTGRVLGSQWAGKKGDSTRKYDETLDHAINQMSFPGTRINILKFDPIPHFNERTKRNEVKIVKITQKMNYKPPEQVHYIFKNN